MTHLKYTPQLKRKNQLHFDANYIFEKITQKIKLVKKYGDQNLKKQMPQTYTTHV